MIPSGDLAEDFRGFLLPKIRWVNCECFQFEAL